MSHFGELIHPEDREGNLAETRRLQAGELQSFEIWNRYVHKDGRPVWVRKFVSTLPDETGKPAHFLVLVTDVTASRQAAEQLREREERLRAIMDATPDAIITIDREGVIEALWKVVLADGQRAQEEDALLRLVANLLGISDRDSAIARQRVSK